MVKKFRRYDYSFWQNPRTWRTDRQTDGQTDTAWQHRPHLCIASRGKNASNKVQSIVGHWYIYWQQKITCSQTQKEFTATRAALTSVSLATLAAESPPCQPSSPLTSLSISSSAPFSFKLWFSASTIHLSVDNKTVIADIKQMQFSNYYLKKNQKLFLYKLQIVFIVTPHKITWTQQDRIFWYIYSHTLAGHSPSCAACSHIDLSVVHQQLTSAISAKLLHKSI